MFTKASKPFILAAHSDTFQLRVSAVLTLSVLSLSLFIVFLGVSRVALVLCVLLPFPLQVSLSSASYCHFLASLHLRSLPYTIMILLKPLWAGRKMASLDPTHIEGMLASTEAAVLGWVLGVNISVANQLSGTIPAIFATLGSLVNFDVGVTQSARVLLSENHISGTLPSFEFANLSDFASFSVNPISGAMPNTMRHGSVAILHTKQEPCTVREKMRGRDRETERWSGRGRRCVSYNITLSVRFFTPGTGLCQFAFSQSRISGSLPQSPGPFM
jgi:hypothetical protein